MEGPTGAQPHGSEGFPVRESEDGAPRRTGRRRDRRGRGPRGPAVIPGPLTPRGAGHRPSRQERFDALVLDLVRSLEERWKDELGLLEYAVEETPLLPVDWADSSVPLASVVPAGKNSAGVATPTRIVVFRRPIELRCESPGDLPALVLTVLVEQLSEVLGRPPEEIDPRYDAG